MTKLCEFISTRWMRITVKLGLKSDYQMKQFETPEAASLTTVGSGITSITLFGLSINELGALIAGLTALVSFAVQMWATARREKRERELHEARIKKLRDDTA